MAKIESDAEKEDNDEANKEDEEMEDESSQQSPSDQTDSKAPSVKDDNGSTIKVQKKTFHMTTETVVIQGHVFKLLTDKKGIVHAEVVSRQKIELATMR